MRRNKVLTDKRVKLIGLFFDIKVSKGMSSKRARLELAELLGVCIHTINNDMTKYRKNQPNYKSLKA